MSDNELDKETISEIGQHLINQEFDKINIDDFKIIENKIREKKNISAVITANLKPILIIVVVLEYLIYTFLISDSFSKLVLFGLLSFFNIFLLGILLFSISEFANHRKEHTIFSLLSPVFVMVANFLFPKGKIISLNPDGLASLLIFIFIYFIYTFYVYLLFINSVADKIIGVFFSRPTDIAFNKGNTIVFKLDGKIKPEVENYLSVMLSQFFNLRFFDIKKSEKHISKLYSMDNLELAPMYRKLIKYHLFMCINLSEATLTFSFFKKYFDRLIINDEAIRKTKLLEYFLPNICKNMKKVETENFEEITKIFQEFDNELLGKQYAAKMKKTGSFKMGWFFNKYVVITITLAALVIIVYNYNLFSSMAGWITLHETLASGIIGALVVIIVQFVIRQRS